MVDRLWGFSLWSRRDAATVNGLLHRLYIMGRLKGRLTKAMGILFAPTFNIAVRCYRNVVGCQDPETIETGPHTVLAHDITAVWGGGEAFRASLDTFGSSERMKMPQFMGIYKMCSQLLLAG